jgi:hypothetical protein
MIASSPPALSKTAEKGFSGLSKNGNPVSGINQPNKARRNV